MSAEAVGRQFPATVTLDDLTVMNAADRHGHRYELSPQGVLYVMPPAGWDHAAIASRLFAWFLTAGWPADHVLQNLGVRVEGEHVNGGRIPDLTLCSRPYPGSIWLPSADLLLVVEIVSPSSVTVDEVVKLREYAAAGIRRYWIVDQDDAQHVIMHVLGSDGVYAVAARVSFDSMVKMAPDDFGLGWVAR